MPSRIIKESIRGSEDLASVSAEAERLFWRLIVTVDDFGRFDARPKTIIGQCLTAFLGVVTAHQVEGWLCELQSAGLIKLYIVEDRPYLVLTKWDKHQRRRAKDSKFPAPEDGCEHPLSNDSERGQVQTFAAYNVNENVNENGNGNGPLPPLEDESELDLDTYTQEVERQMVVCGARAGYSAVGDAYKWIQKFHASKIPISFIRAGIVQAYAKNNEISTFTYCAKMIKDLWARELAKKEPITSIEISASKPRAPDIDHEFLEKFSME